MINTFIIYHLKSYAYTTGQTVKSIGSHASPLTANDDSRQLFRSLLRRFLLTTCCYCKNWLMPKILTDSTYALMFYLYFLLNEN